MPSCRLLGMARKGSHQVWLNFCLQMSPQPPSTLSFRGLPEPQQTQALVCPQADPPGHQAPHPGTLSDSLLREGGETHPGPEGQRDTLFPHGPPGHGSDFCLLPTEPASRGECGGPNGLAPGSSRQASPATLGLLRAMETKAILASYLQFCYWAKWRSCSPGHPERGEGEEVDGGLHLPGLCEPGQRSAGQGWPFTWLVGPGRGSKGLSPRIRDQLGSRSPCGGDGTHSPWGDGLVGDAG